MEHLINKEIDESSDNIEQIALLNRVKDLDTETSLSNRNNTSSRINFGIEEVATPSKVMTIENSMRNVLNLGGDKNKKGRCGHGPTPDKGYLGQIAKSVAPDKPIPDKRSPLRQRNKESEITTSKVTGNSIGGEENLFERSNTLCNGSSDKLTIRSNISSHQPTIESLKPKLEDLASKFFSQGPPQLPSEDLAKPKLSQQPSPFSLGDLANQHLSQEKSKGLLGDLATQHLSQEKFKSSLVKSSIGELSTQHLTLGKSKSPLGDLATRNLTQGKSTSSLGDLATQHLSQEGILRLGSISILPLEFPASKNPSIMSIFSKQPPPGFGTISLPDGMSTTSKSSPFTLKPLISVSTPCNKSLGLLADNYLGSPERKLDGQSDKEKSVGGSGFTIPALFSSATQASTSCSINPTEIDLMSALKLAGETDSAQSLIGRQSPTVDDNVMLDDSHIVVPDFTLIYSRLRKRKSSIFGRVIARKWARVDTYVPLKIDIHRINFHQRSHLPSEGEPEPSFQFTTSSPDDIVLKAQSQSRAFVRPQTAVLRS